MGSGDWLKMVMSSKKGKDDASKKKKGSSAPKKSNGFNWKSRSLKESTRLIRGSTGRNSFITCVPVEDLAAIRIQTAFRAYKARKVLRRLKGTVKLQNVTRGYCVKKQSTITLNYLHSWSKIQAQIRTRRLCMVIEGKLRQKKLENQLKLEAKLHDLEVEWSGGSETMEEILEKIYNREEAAVKRERAMAYAFSHQWRANSNYLGLNNNELSKANWGWSWKERWIAARPWESRVPPISPKKVQSRQPSKVGKNTNTPTPKSSISAKTPSSTGKKSTKARRLSYPDVGKPAPYGGSIKAGETSTNKEQLAS